MPPEQKKVHKIFKDTRLPSEIVEAIVSHRRTLYSKDSTRLLFSPLANPQNYINLLAIITQIKINGGLTDPKAIPKSTPIFQVLLTAGIINNEGKAAKNAQARLQAVHKLELIYKAANGNYVAVGIYKEGVAYIDSDGAPAPDKISIDQQGSTKSFEAILVGGGVQFYNINTQGEQQTYSGNSHFYDGQKQGDGEKNRSLACTLTAFDTWEVNGIGASYRKLRNAEIIPRKTLIDMARENNRKLTIDYTNDVKDAAGWRRWDEDYHDIVKNYRSFSAAVEIDVRPFTFSQIKGELDKCQTVDDDGVINTFDIKEKHIGVKSANGSITFYQRFLRMFEALKPVLNKNGDQIVRVRVKRPLDPVWQDVCKQAGEKVFGVGNIIILNKEEEAEEEAKAAADDAMVGAPIAA